MFHPKHVLIKYELQKHRNNNNNNNIINNAIIIIIINTANNVNKYHKAGMSLNSTVNDKTTG